MRTTTRSPAVARSGLAGRATLIEVATALTVTAWPTPLNALIQDVPERRPSETAIFTSAGHPDGRLSEIGRLGTAMFLEPGRFVFVDTRALHLLVFVDIGTGEAVPAGREGDGPEEFRSATLVSRNGDGAVFVWDSRRERLSLVGAVDGKGVVTQPEYDRSLLKSGGLSVFGGGSRPVAAYADGTLIVRENPSPTGALVGIPRRDPGPYRDTVAYNLAAPGVEKRLLIALPGTEMFSSVSRGGVQSTGPRIFGHELLQRQVGQHLAVARTDPGSVLVFDRSGAVVAEIPLPPGKRATESQIEAERDRRIASNQRLMAGMAEMRARVRPESVGGDRASDGSDDRLRDLSANEITPAIDRMLGDLDGRLWLRLFDPADGDIDPGSVSEQWLVWDISAPRLLFTVTLPNGEGLLDAAGDRVLVRTSDEFDVDYLLVKEIVR